MPAFPSTREQAWLVDQLAVLVAQAGEAPLVRARIRTPTVEDFPDPWGGDPTSLRRLCLRMLSYAGVAGQEVRIETSSPQPQTRPLSFSASAPAPDGRPLQIAGVESDGRIRWRHGETLWFIDHQPGALTFGCEARAALPGDRQLVGTVAREVTRAWRRLHALVHPDPSQETKLNDLTTIYLGLGLCTVHAPSPGGLPSSHLAFLLGAQLLAREESCWATRRLLGHLEPARRADVRRAVRGLRRPRGALRHRLQLDLLDDPPMISL